MKQLTNISFKIEQVINKYNQLAKQTREYGKGMILNQSEIHTLTLIGEDPGINVVTIAKQRGITRGAVSQMIHKLNEKGLICKQVSPETDNEVCLSLTPMGLEAYNAHTKYHEETDKLIQKQFENIPEDYEIFLIKILDQFEKTIDKKLQR